MIGRTCDGSEAARRRAVFVDTEPRPSVNRCTYTDSVFLSKKPTRGKGGAWQQGTGVYIDRYVSHRRARHIPGWCAPTGDLRKGLMRREGETACSQAAGRLCRKPGVCSSRKTTKKEREEKGRSRAKKTQEPTDAHASKKKNTTEPQQRQTTRK